MPPTDEYPDMLTQDDRDWIESELEKVPVAQRDWLRKELEGVQWLINASRELADCLIPADFWKELSDDDFFAICGPYQDDPGSEETFVAQIGLRLLQRVGVDDLTPDERQSYWVWAVWALQTSIADEFHRRYQKIENEDGKAVREFLNEQAKQARRKLVAMATRRLTWHGEFRDPEKARKEIASMADEALWERISVLPGWDRLVERLRAMLRGDYNRIPQNVRKSLKERLWVIDKRSRSTVRIDEPVQPDEDTSPDQILATYGFVHVADQEHKMLVEEGIFNHPDLTDEDTKVIVMLQEGLTQIEIAAELWISQPAVSRQIERIRAKLGQ